MYTYVQNENNGLIWIKSDFKRDVKRYPSTSFIVYKTAQYMWWISSVV